MLLYQINCHNNTQSSDNHHQQVNCTCGVDTAQRETYTEREQYKTEKEQKQNNPCSIEKIFLCHGICSRALCLLN
jgi:hypothetical protein